MFKISLDDLFRTNACRNALEEYCLRKACDIDWDTVKEIRCTTGDQYNNLHWLSERFKLSIILTYKNKSAVFENGNKTKATNSNGSFCIWEYDSHNNLIKETDSNGYVCTWEYDKNNKLTKKTYSNGDVWTYEYDKNNNKTKQTFSSGDVCTWEYDSNNKLTKETNSSGYVCIWEYDKNNKLVKASSNQTITLNDIEAIYK